LLAKFRIVFRTNTINPSKTAPIWAVFLCLDFRS
jgi:hypothetical protein